MKHPLELVFRDVLRQVTVGKGDRHGGARVPFYKQQWVSLAEVHGHGFLTGQASKKLTEAVESGNHAANPEAFEREVMGAIAYLGMAMLQLRGYPSFTDVHTLYEQGDRNIPAAALDVNHDVVLKVCKECGRVESELQTACDAPRVSL